MNEICSIITPILHRGKLSLSRFTQLAMELEFHSTILPPSKSVHGEHINKYSREESGDDSGSTVGFLSITI